MNMGVQIPNSIMIIVFTGCADRLYRRPVITGNENRALKALLNRYVFSVDMKVAHE